MSEKERKEIENVADEAEVSDAADNITAAEIAAPIKANEKSEPNMLGYIKLCFPVLLFPLLYFPYTLWLQRGFSDLAIRLFQGIDSRLVRLMLTGNNTILLFWILVSAVVTLVSIIIAIWKMRPWFVIPVYIAVMFSLCGIFSLLFYTLILR